MKIAVYVDSSHEIARFSQTGRVRLYVRAGYGWTVADEIPFPISTDMSLADIKAQLAALVARLPGCQTFLSGEVRGLIYSLLQEEHGFRVWKSSGQPEGQLDDIIQRDVDLAVLREKEAAEQAFAAAFSSPSGGCSGGGCSGGGGGRKRSEQALQAIQSMTERVADGHYRINLSDILNKYKNANSMDILVPLMEGPLREGTTYRSLEILCDHLPRWFSQKVSDLDLTAKCVTIDGHPGGIRATVSKAHP